MDIGNKQGVGARGLGVDGAKFINVLMPKHEMTNEEALVHAAWIVALADPTRTKFSLILDQVLNT